MLNNSQYTAVQTSDNIVAGDCKKRDKKDHRHIKTVCNNVIDFELVGDFQSCWKYKIPFAHIFWIFKWILTT